jgi:hypothetical protein
LPRLWSALDEKSEAGQRHSEDGLYAQAPALSVFHPIAVRQGRVLQFAERLALFAGDVRGDLALRILVDDQQVFFDKAKRDEAKRLGVRRDPRYHFFIDALELPPAQ